jgi:hypothetical protein
MTGVDRVVLDANALLAPGRSGVDVFDEIERLLGAVELVVPEAVRRELRGLANDDPDAALGLEMAEDRCTVVRTEDGRDGEGPSAGAADDVIVAMAAEAGAGDEGGDDGHDTEDEGPRLAVVTNDAALRDRLHGVGVPVLFLRQERHLEISYP